ACDQAGLSPVFLNARDLSFRAVGGPYDAAPHSIDEAMLRDALSRFDVVIVPGFVAIGAAGRAVLLDRGGSDLTAVAIAAALGVEQVELIKDVDGVYDRDPATHAGEAKRYSAINYEEALNVAGALVQSRAIEEARERGVEINVAQTGAREHTVIGAASAPPTIASGKRRLRVALAGCGIVGAGVADLIALEPEAYDISAVLVRDLRKPRPATIEASEKVTSIEALFASEPDIVIDVLSSGDAGADLTRRALQRAVSVVSANKQAIADDINALAALARENGALFGYSASVGGGAPMIETARRIAAEDRIERIDAIVNGTVNFILSALADGKDFDAAVKEAQVAGFAEADPTADLSGADAVAKAKILAWDAFGETLAGMPPPMALDETALARIAAEPGVWKQLTSVRRGPSGLEGEVRLARVNEGDFFADLVAEQNGARFETRSGAVRAVKGRGAGAVPTAHSVFADLGAIFRDKQA
ncbi:MAG: homoserine dehydrogenase, partial [Pseudomonadota bacterium]